MSSSNQHIETLLRSRKLKATPNRISLLNEIASYESAIPFSAIQDKLKNINRVTLYRSMHILLEKGIIHKAYNKNNDMYYAMCGDKCTATAHNHNHVHFECTTCNQIKCEYLNQEVQIYLPGHQISEVNITLRGTCKDCL